MILKYVQLGSSLSFKYVWLNNKDTFCLYDFNKILRFELVDEFTKILPSAFRPFISHHQGVLACMKSVLKDIFRFFITLQNYVNTELDKIKMLINLKNRTLSTEIKYYQEI